jgi:mono/diheme cytochrome c family protein
MANDPDPFVRIQVYLAFRAAQQTVPAALLDRPNPIISALQRVDQTEAQLALLGQSAKQGRQIYETICATCHGADGQGAKQGDKLLAPVLAKNELFQKGQVDLLVRVLLKGETGPIAGINYGEGFMPPWEAAYNDEQLASVLNFIGERWNNWRKPVATAEKIARIRSQFAQRNTPWTSEEIHAALKQNNP